MPGTPHWDPHAPKATAHTGSATPLPAGGGKAGLMMAQLIRAAQPLRSRLCSPPCPLPAPSGSFVHPQRRREPGLGTAGAAPPRARGPGAAPRAGAVYCKGNEDFPRLSAGEEPLVSPVLASDEGRWGWEGWRTHRLSPALPGLGSALGMANFGLPSSPPRLRQRLEVLILPQGSADHPQEIIPEPLPPSSEKSRNSQLCCMQGQFLPGDSYVNITWQQKHLFSPSPPC